MPQHTQRRRLQVLGWSRGGVDKAEQSNKQGKEKGQQQEVAQATSLFECNICLDQVHEPVLTLCGHLYCWPCLYRWIEQHQLCPVCKAGVTKESVVPIYGRGSENIDPRTRAASENHGDCNIPRRPLPRRFEPRASESFSTLSRTAVSHMVFPSLIRLLLDVSTLADFQTVSVLPDGEDNRTYLSRALLLVGCFVLSCLLLF